MFAESDIKVGDVIGEGHFGVAYKARIKGCNNIVRLTKNKLNKLDTQEESRSKSTQRQQQQNR